MIELGTRQTVIMQAAPFCFGPVSTSLAIASQLRKHDIAIVWFAEGTALELLKAGSYDDYIIHFDINDPSHHQIYKTYVEEADLIVVNTDPDFAEFALQHNPNLIYIDILYWMWDKLPSVVNDCKLYIFEDYVLSDDQIKRIGTPENSLRVAPLINNSNPETNQHHPKEDHLLVSLGGLHRPNNFSRDILSAYGNMVRRAVSEVLKHNDNFSKVYFVGGGLSSYEETLSNGVKIQYGCLSKESYDQVLHTAKAAILSSGLTGFFEVANVNTPVFFLPPHNYSQYLQLESYKEFLSENYYCDWKQLGIETELMNNLPEDEMLIKVDKALAEVTFKDALLAKHISEFLTKGYTNYDSAPLAGVIEKLEARCQGGTARVAIEIVSQIEKNSRTVVNPSKRRNLEIVQFPKKVILELFGGCQLRCPLCPTGNRQRPGRASGALKISTVEKLLDEIGHHIETIELFNWGEPFLNPDACKIIRMIADRGIYTILSSNLQHIPDPTQIVNSGLSELIVSCHGFTQETYEKYMIGGKIQKTLDNLKSIIEAGKSGLKTKLILRYVVFAHNEHELPLVKKYFEGTPVIIEESIMRMDMRDEILNSTGQNLQTYGEWVPDSSRFYDKDELTAPRSPLGCNLPFEETVIDVDGSISMCCSSFDPKYNVGNFLSEGFGAVWNGEKYQEARRVVTGRGETGKESVICRTCKNNGYRDF